MYATTILIWARYAASTSSAADFLGLTAAPPTQFEDSFFKFSVRFEEFPAQILIRICLFCYFLSPRPTVLSDDENFIDFEGFEVCLDLVKMKIIKKTYFED